MNFPKSLKSILDTKIYLTKERWEHIIQEHPIIEKYLKEIEKTIAIPDIIIGSKYDKEILLYYKFYKSIYRGKFITVIVKHTEERSFILTAYITDKIKGGISIWKKN
ncbi:MAG: hypothetical protein HY934_10650 [Candidatus Firestonebacteria bacterium]|nr:hypothetical protein [Candidatus Firestonebacteria bacterium]